MQNIENFTLLTWNIRGINNTIARKNLRAIARQLNPWVMVIQETKCDTLSDSMKTSIWDDSHDWLFSPATGQSGGLATSWDKRKLKLIDSEMNHNILRTRWEVIIEVALSISLTT